MIKAHGPATRIHSKKGLPPLPLWKIRLLYKCLTILCSYQHDSITVSIIIFRCLLREEAINDSIIHPVCHDAIPSDYVFIFLSSYVCLNDIIIDQLYDALRSATNTDEYCRNVLIKYYCNYVYPSCDNQGRPAGICRESCQTFLPRCDSEFIFLHNIGMTTGLFSFSLECEETLQFVADSGLDVTKISVSDECVNISGNESSKTSIACI